MRSPSTFLYIKLIENAKNYMRKFLENSGLDVSPLWTISSLGTKSDTTAVTQTYPTGSVGAMYKELNCRPQAPVQSLLPTLLWLQQQLEKVPGVPFPLASTFCLPTPMPREGAVQQCRLLRLTPRCAVPWG